MQQYRVTRENTAAQQIVAELLLTMERDPLGRAGNNKHKVQSRLV